MGYFFPMGIKIQAGKGIEVIPDVLSRGNSNLGVAEIMDLRIDRGHKSSFFYEHFDSSDLAVYGAGNNNEFYVLLGRDNNGNLSSNARTALDLVDNGNLASLESSMGLKKGQIREYSRSRLYRPRIALEEGLDIVRENNLIRISTPRRGNVYLRDSDAVVWEEIWRTLARNPNNVPEEFSFDSSLLGEYVKFIEGGKKENSALMRVFLGASFKIQDSFSLFGLNGGLYGSSLVADEDNFRFESSRFLTRE